jgi:hypothetical protein
VSGASVLRRRHRTVWCGVATPAVAVTAPECRCPNRLPPALLRLRPAPTAAGPRYPFAQALFTCAMVAQTIMPCHGCAWLQSSPLVDRLARMNAVLQTSSRSKPAFSPIRPAWCCSRIQRLPGQPSERTRPPWRSATRAQPRQLPVWHRSITIRSL